MTSYDCTLDALTSYHYRVALVRYCHELLQQNQYLLQQLHHDFARGELRRVGGGAARMRVVQRFARAVGRGPKDLSKTLIYNCTPTSPKLSTSGLIFPKMGVHVGHADPPWSRLCGEHV